MRRSRNDIWNPVEALDSIRREIDEMFEPTAGAFLSNGLFDREFSPAMDVVENADGYLVCVDLPGVDKKDLEISAADNVLTIKGEKKEDKKSKSGKYFRRESWEGSFQRTISIPYGVDPEKIDAKLADGVLTIALQKREEAKPKQIAVNVQ
jgi:HSP20 family protein